MTIPALQEQKEIIYNDYNVEAKYMSRTDFISLYEELSQLNEKWYNLENYDGRLWYSDSEFRFRDFMRNISTSGLKGVRLVIAPDLYLVANAEEFDHTMMCEVAEEELGIEVPDDVESTTCGIPKCTDFELANYEINDLKQAAMEDPDDESLQKYLNYDADKDYKGNLIADYGTFELDLYQFNSKNYPSYKSKIINAKYFEDSETYRVLKPMLKRIYIYGEN